MAQHVLSRFAPAERAGASELQQQATLFADQQLIRHLFDALPAVLAILNRHRQIIYANQALLDLVGVEEESLIRGRRPGEVLGCVHSHGAGGCGTSEHCSTCGAVLAILAGIEGRQAVEECRITRCIDDRRISLDLQVMATPFAYAGESLIILAVSDISHEKRRRALERIFFHDILNVAGSLKGFAELLSPADAEEQRELAGLIRLAAQQTIEEIEAQRTLSAAENRDLTPNIEPLLLPEVLSALLATYRCHDLARGRELTLGGDIPQQVFRSDRVLLGRILGNMVKNALEASRRGERVVIVPSVGAGTVEIAVHNSGVLPRAVQLQIFQRSFSTKGSGRGLGTYSMKLLSEYLGADVSFTSTVDEGTVFRLRLPAGSA